LLHPVMPFVTEAIWAELPRTDADPAMLIQARWPSRHGRDAGAERNVAALIDLIRGIRNARAEARVDPGAWLPVDVAIPIDLGIAFEQLRPAVERLARARPLERHLTREALHGTVGGGLIVVSGDSEAVVGVAHRDESTAQAEHARLSKELAAAERLLSAARARLTNEEFLSRAPAEIVAGARARQEELVEQVERLRERLGGR
ncbi:MAG TPA: class I tRNA ligase family protein, partial [Candidatus Limnocylindrales bacterium]